MRRFRDVSIRTKLTLLMAGAVSAALLLAWAGSVFNDVRLIRSSMAAELTTMAEVLAPFMKPALDFGDSGTAQEVLDPLSRKPTVRCAHVYDAQGNVFANYPEDLPGADAPPVPQEIGEPYFEDGFVHVFMPVMQEGDAIGTIYLCGSMQDLNRQIRTESFNLAIVLTASLLVVVLIGYRLQRVISVPIMRLSKAAETVSAEADYSIRVKSSGRDEIGVLCDGFNSMLAQIQARDAELDSYKNHLEELVHDRTTDLEAKTLELARVIGELERSNKDLDDFAYIASHDLKEPLRGISNYATFLAEDYAEKLDAEGREKLETLKRLCQRQESLIDSLLHYSRVGRAEMAIEETNLNKLLGDVLDSLHVFLKEENVDVRTPHTLPIVTCDAVRVREVFHNLISNAIKYNDKTEKLIEIGCQRTMPLGMPGIDDDRPENREVFVFYVRDNGIGIREKHLDSIFRIFKRLHGRDKFGGGTGAGLTFVKQIVERHGGSIAVDSRPGEGSTFYFTLK